MRRIIDFEIIADALRERKPLDHRSGTQQRQHANVVARQCAVDRRRAFDQAVQVLEFGQQSVDMAGAVGAQRGEIAERLALARRVMVERRSSGEFRQTEQRIARHGQGRGLGDGALGPGGDFAAFRAGQDRIAEALDVIHHRHAFEHRRAVVLDQNWDDPLADQADHGFGIVVEHGRFLQRPALERRRHAHAKAQRAVLEHVKSHATLSLRRARGARGADTASQAAAAGAQASARPPQQFSVRNSTSAVMAANRAA